MKVIEVLPAGHNLTIPDLEDETAVRVKAPPIAFATVVVQSDHRPVVAPDHLLQFGLEGTVARGLTTKEIADRLCISPKIADHHIQHIYNKIGVSTRAAAALWAMQHPVVSSREAASEMRE